MAINTYIHTYVLIDCCAHPLFRVEVFKDIYYSNMYIYCLSTTHPPHLQLIHPRVSPCAFVSRPVANGLSENSAGVSHKKRGKNKQTQTVKPRLVLLRPLLVFSEYMVIAKIWTLLWHFDFQQPVRKYFTSLGVTFCVRTIVFALLVLQSLLCCLS
jgi:hypothetical protein